MLVNTVHDMSRRLRNKPLTSLMTLPTGFCGWFRARHLLWIKVDGNWARAGPSVRRRRVPRAVCHVSLCHVSCVMCRRALCRVSCALSALCRVLCAMCCVPSYCVRVPSIMYHLSCVMRAWCRSRALCRGLCSVCPVWCAL